MTPAELLAEASGRVLENGLAAIEGLGDDELAARPAAGANPIGWLVWHAARVQDDHVADVAGTSQVWTEQGFADRFGLDLPVEDTGFGHDVEDVDRVRVGADGLAAYLRATHAATLAFLGTVGTDDLDRVVDEGWDPPVTLGVRLVSVVDDGTQHVGQAAYVRGLLGR